MTTSTHTTRASWDDYFMSIAKQVATRATCDRAHVGCVVTSTEKNILATGYNGSIPGASHCDDVGHLMVDGHCARTNHAEANAIAQAAKNGTSLRGARAYVTHFPCWPCFRLLVCAGVEVIVYDEAYRIDENVFAHANLSRVTLRKLSDLQDTDPQHNLSEQLAVGDCVRHKGQTEPLPVGVVIADVNGSVHVVVRWHFKDGSKCYCTNANANLNRISDLAFHAALAK